MDNSETIHAGKVASECMPIIVHLATLAQSEGIDAAKDFALIAAEEEAKACGQGLTAQDALLTWLAASVFILAGAGTRELRERKQNG